VGEFEGDKEAFVEKVRGGVETDYGVYEGEIDPHTITVRTLASLSNHGHFACLHRAAVSGVAVGGVRNDMKSTDEGGGCVGDIGEVFTKFDVRVKEGKKRMVRRLFAKLGFHVVDLVRTRYGEMCLGTLGEGEWRWGTTEEEDWARGVMENPIVE